MPQSRREIFKIAFTFAASSLLPNAHGQAPASTPSNLLPPASRSKFYLDGSVRAFAGNTVICHLPAQCALRDAAVSLHQATLAAPFHAKFALLPTDSYHMTVFGGANDQERVPTGWPADIPLDTPIEECTKILNARLANFKIDCPLPIQMKINASETIQFPEGCSLRLVPADKSANRELRRLRDRLAEVFRFRAADHADYKFHITIAYPLGQLTPSEDRAYRNLLAEHVSRIQSAAPLIELGLPEFCSFRDMFRFDLLHYLRT